MDHVGKLCQTLHSSHDITVLLEVFSPNPCRLIIGTLTTFITRDLNVNKIQPLKESLHDTMSLLTLLLGLPGAFASVVHYPPSSTTINNLTFVLNGPGTPGIFNSSVTPDKEYGIYNWCNMPHVRQREYKCVCL